MRIRGVAASIGLCFDFGTVLEGHPVDDYKKNASVETFSVKLSDLNGRADAS